jgi:hypothetical protein
MCAIVFYALDLLELKSEYLSRLATTEEKSQELTITTTPILEGFTELK